MPDLTIMREFRRNVANLLLSFDQADQNRIPAGLNNNLIWNAGHLLATTDLLIYALSGLKTPSGREFIDRYRKGTRPDGEVSAEEIKQIADLLVARVDQLDSDLRTLDFSNFKEYTTSAGVTLRSVEDAVSFNVAHEAMHFGTMLAIRNLLRNSE